jgi:hypothetical protein
MVALGAEREFAVEPLSSDADPHTAASSTALTLAFDRRLVDSFQR